MTIVLINTSASEQPVTLLLRGTPKTDALRVIRTTATEACKELDAAKVADGKTSLTMPGQSIATLTSIR